MSFSEVQVVWIGYPPGKPAWVRSRNFDFARANFFFWSSEVEKKFCKIKLDDSRSSYKPGYNVQYSKLAAVIVRNKLEKLEILPLQGVAK